MDYQSQNQQMKGNLISGPIAILPDITKNLDAQSNAHNKILQL